MQYLRYALAGILIGALLFMAPFFIVRALGFILIITLIFRLLRGPRHYGYGPWRGGRVMGMARRVRAMSAEEFAAFEARMAGGCRHHQPDSSQPVSTTV